MSTPPADPALSADPAPEATPASGLKVVPPHRKLPLPRELDDYDELRRRLTSSVETTRKTAENWRNGLSGLVALVTAFLIFKGQETITSYVQWAQVLLTALLALGLVLAVTALWRFLAAANGRVRLLSTEEIREEGGVTLHDLATARNAIADLVAARVLAVAGAALLAGAICFTWFAPAAPAAPEVPPGYLEATFITGDEQTATVCGELESQNQQGLRLLDKAGQSRLVPSASIISAIIVAKCP